jgi:hypothetical protein
MKILIAVELPERKYGDSVLSKYNQNGEFLLDKSEVLNLQYGTIISFPKRLIEIDRNSDEFFEAEFYGVLEK